MHHNKPHLKSIGMFDSGLGGLTVMQQVIHLLPKESVIYFGDTARVPYGGKSGPTILRYSIENVIFLMEHDIKILVIPCNTASSYAVDKLQQIFNIPVVGVIEPGAEKASLVTRQGNIAVLGTKATIQSKAYELAIKRRLPDAKVIGQACPLFVPIVEENFVSHDAARMIVREYLAPLRREKIDTLLLGCTHYPLLRSLIESELDADVTIVDPAVTCAETVSFLLKELNLNTTASTKPHYSYYVSDDAEKFRSSGKTYLGMPLDKVEIAPNFR